VPIINWISLLHHDGETEKELVDRARERMDVIGEMEISIGALLVLCAEKV
jgi:hypothetical protein